MSLFPATERAGSAAGPDHRRRLRGADRVERRLAVKITVKRVEAIKATRIHLTEDCAA